MKRYFIYTFAALALVLSCNRAEPEQQSGDLIRIGATIADVPSTKALLNKADLRGGTVNPEVKIYDDLTDFVGTITVGNQTYVGTATQPVNVNYINDTMVWSEGQGENATWNFNSGIAWRWTRTGIHHFYGWLTKDPAGLQNNGTGTAATFNESTKVLSVPAIIFTKDTPQFDFSYSDIVTKDVNSGFSADESVNLPLNHLFSAVALEVVNSTTDNAYISKLEIKNIKTAKKADVNFAVDGKKPKVTYLAETTQPDFAITWPSAATVDENYGHLIAEGTSINPTRLDVIGGSKLEEADAPNFFMMWPQNKAELADATIEVEYYIAGVLDENDPDKLAKKTKTLSLATASGLESIEPGVKYAISLQFKEKTISLTLKPMPWIMDYMDIDYAASSILANANKDNEGVLWLYKYDGGAWKAGSRDRQITMTGGNPIQGRFYILAPTSGKWQVTTFPAEAAQYFIIARKDSEGNYVPSNSGVIEDLVDNDNVFTGYVEFYVLPNPEHPTLPATQYLNFNIDFMINGEWRNGNTEFNRKNWTITREPGN